MKIEKIQVTTPARQLSANWTIESDSDFTLLTDEQLVQQIKSEIEWEMLSITLISAGWHKVTLSGPPPTPDWISKNIKGAQHNHNCSTWLFANEKDAVTFKMWWS